MPASKPSPDEGMVASDRRVSPYETSEGPRAGFPETSLSSFGGSRDAVDEVIKIHNVKVTSSVILRMPPSPSGEGFKNGDRAKSESNGESRPT